MAWLAWNAQAHGVDDAVLKSTEAVSVRDAGPFIRFMPSLPSSRAALIFLPGATVDPRAYAPLLRRLADSGFAVTLVRLPWRTAPTRTAQAAVRERVANIVRGDTSRRWFLGGHSRGAALSARFASADPARFAGLILIGTTHPKDADLSDLPLPVMKVYGTRDCVADAEAVMANAHLLPPSTRWVRIHGGNHAQFAWYGRQLGDCNATISRDAQQTATVSAVSALLAAMDEAGDTSIQ